MLGRVILAGGGTGGHLFPGIAVYEELRRRDPELSTLFVGTAAGIETRVVPKLGERLACIDVAPLKGRSPRQLLTNLSALPQAGFQAGRIVRSFRPDVVIGVGGYAAGPTVLAARALGVPTALLEQNAHVGLTNRLLSRLVDRAYLSFEETQRHFSSASVRVVGNPVRRQFVTAGHMARMDPAGFEMRARRILVLGGSQGARVLNEVVPVALARAGLAASGIEVVHQAGHALCDAVRARYATLGVRATVTPFVDDMARAYGSAALVIGRAGATSLAEICAVGRPSILVPYPFAADDHQWHNARVLEACGAALSVRESELTVEGLAATVATLMSQPEKRRRMADAARALGRPDAAAAIVDDLWGWLGCGPSEDATEGDADGDVEGDSDVEGDGGAGALDGDGSQRVVATFPPVTAQRRTAGRRRARRRSVAWSQPDRYYGTQAVACAE